MAERVAFSHLNRPYVWGGDNPLVGFDCSGLAIEILKSVAILPRAGDWTAQGLHTLFQDLATDDPDLGCLVFWGDPIKHVEFCLNRKLSIGASGGRSITRTVQDAIDQDAYIKIRPFGSRSGIIRFVDPFMRTGALEDRP